MNEQLIERLRACKIFYEGKNLLLHEILRDYRDFLLDAQGQRYQCCSYPQEKPFLAVTLAVLSLLVLAKNKRTAEQERQDWQAEIAKAQQKNRVLTVDYQKDAYRLKMIDGVWKMKYLQKQNEANGGLPNKDVRPNQVSYLTFEDGDLSRVHLLYDARKPSYDYVGNFSDVWAIQSSDRQKLMSALCGTEMDIPWETDTAGFLIANIGQVEEVFPKITVQYESIAPVPLQELVTIDFLTKRGKKKCFRGNLRQYPPKHFREGRFFKHSTNIPNPQFYRTYKYPTIRVAENLDAWKENLQELRDYRRKTVRIILWNPERIRIDDDVYENLLEARKLPPILVNCQGNYRIYANMKSAVPEPVACYGMTHRYLEHCTMPWGVYSPSGVEVQTVELAGIGEQDVRQFLNGCRWLHQHAQEDLRLLLFRSLAKREWMRLEDEVRPFDAAWNGHCEVMARMRENVSSREDIVRQQQEILGKIEQLYTALMRDGAERKSTRLQELLSSLDMQDRDLRVALLVPEKWHSEEFLNMFPHLQLSVMQLSQYDVNEAYDLVIVTGRLYLSALPLAWNTRRFIVLLYPFEREWYESMMRSWERAEDAFDCAMGLEIGTSEAVQILREDASIEDTWTELEAELQCSWREHLAAFLCMEGRQGKSEIPLAHVVRMAVLTDGRYLLMTSRYRSQQCDESTADHFELEEITTQDVVPGMMILHTNDFGTRDELLERILPQIPALAREARLVQSWKRQLRSYRKLIGDDENLRLELNGFGAGIGTTQSIRNWLESDFGDTIGPQEERVFEAMEKVLPHRKENPSWEAYARATRMVRNARNRLNKRLSKDVIPRIYCEWKQGKKQWRPEFQYLQDHIEEFVDVFEIERVFPYEAEVPQNYVNKPIQVLSVWMEQERETDAENRTT